MLARQTGLVNEIHVRVGDPMAAREVAARIERETGYKSVSWQEAHEDLLSTFVIRNIIMYTVVGAILLVASFGTYNIISTITHEKSRDIAIMKSLGLTRGARSAAYSCSKREIIGLVGARHGLCARLCAVPCARRDRDQEPVHGCRSVCRSPIRSGTMRLRGGVALVSSFAAGYVPARKAARLHPVDIIRGAT